MSQAYAVARHYQVAFVAVNLELFTVYASQVVEILALNRDAKSVNRRYYIRAFLKTKGKFCIVDRFKHLLAVRERELANAISLNYACAACRYYFCAAAYVRYRTDARLCTNYREAVRIIIHNDRFAVDCEATACDCKRRTRIKTFYSDCICRAFFDKNCYAVRIAFNMDIAICKRSG